MIARRLLITADRLFGDPGEGLVGKMVDAIRGTVNGTVIVAIAEGLLIGIAYLLGRRAEPDPVHRPDHCVRDAAVRRLGGVHRRGAHAAVSAAAAGLRRSRCSPGAPR